MAARTPDPTLRAIAAATCKAWKACERAGVQQLGKPGRARLRADGAADSRRRAPAARPTGSAQRRRACRSTSPPTPPGDSLADHSRRSGRLPRCATNWRRRARKPSLAWAIRVPGCAFWARLPAPTKIAQGEPFVGRAGQLLTKIIEACTLSRDGRVHPQRAQVPPAGQSQSAAARGGQLPRLSRPAIEPDPAGVHLLPGRGGGPDAAWRPTRRSAACGASSSITTASAVMCTYHPAYLLRNPAAKKDVWEDMKMLMRKMGIELERGAGA